MKTAKQGITIKTPERRHWRRRSYRSFSTYSIPFSRVSIVDYEQVNF